MRALAAVILSAVAAPLLAATPALSPAERTALFRASGFTQINGKWHGCDDPGTASYTPGEIESVADLNGDGLPEAILIEGSSYCYGDAGTGYFILSKQPGGAWKRITDGSGVVTPLKTKGVGGWPDLEIGGPGFCFPVERWNGREYVLNRHQYQGKACRPRR